MPLIGVAHHTTGPHVELYPFYLAPILLVAWFVGPRWGTVMALLSTVSWMVVDLGLVSGSPPRDLVLLNEAIRFGMYMPLVVVAWQWRRALDREVAYARLDTLMQLPNRRAFFEQAKIELERARHYGHPLTSIMMDLDNFKLANDELGHQCGDEFALVLPETGPDAAMAFAKKLRRELLDAMHQGKWPVTFSLGVATFHEMPADVDRLLKPADDLMYAVKQEGKNQIKQAVIEQPAP